MPKKQTRAVHRPSWKAIAEDRQVSVHQLCDELAAERDARANEKATLEARIASLEEQVSDLTTKLETEKGRVTIAQADVSNARRMCDDASGRARENDKRLIALQNLVTALMAAHLDDKKPLEGIFQIREYLDLMDLVGDPTVQSELIQAKRRASDLVDGILCDPVGVVQNSIVMRLCADLAESRFAQRKILEAIPEDFGG